MQASKFKSEFDRVHITELKNDPKTLDTILKSEFDGKIIYILERLGRLESDEISTSLKYLLSHENSDIRSRSVKNLAKFSDVKNLIIFNELVCNDESSEVRRESVSAIGRLRNEESIPFLINYLKDKDPKVVMQAMRGLLVFKNNLSVWKIISKELKKLKSHPNESVIEFIEKELIFHKDDKVNNIKSNYTPTYLKNTTILSDVNEALRYIPDESVDLTFTSPPYYNARDYSIYQSYSQYLSFLEGVFKEVHRVTKEGRFFVLNTSPIIIPRISRSYSSKRFAIPFDIHPYLIKMGWEFIDDIVWLKPEASVKNRNAGFLQHRKPLGYKPNAVTEMIMVYRKKTDKLIDWNMKKYSNEIIQNSKILGRYETTNVWKIDPTFNKVHSAVFPIELCNRIIKYYSFIGDLVFDPFAGSGTLGKACIDMNRNFLLVEKEVKYFETIKSELTKFVHNKNTQNNHRFIKLNELKNLKKNDNH